MPLLRRSAPAIAFVALALLAGCTTPSTPNDDPTGPAVPPASAQPDPVPSLSPTSTPVDLSCDDLVSAQTIYDFNPNYGSIDGYKPAAGSVGAAALDDQGVACRWQNQTSGDAIDLSVADLDAASIATLKDAAAAAGTPANSGDAEGYFQLDGQAGRLALFDGTFWVVLSSTYFGTAADAQPIVDSVLAALKG